MDEKETVVNGLRQLIAALSAGRESTAVDPVTDGSSSSSASSSSSSSTVEHLDESTFTHPQITALNRPPNVLLLEVCKTIICVILTRTLLSNKTLQTPITHPGSG